MTITSHQNALPPGTVLMEYRLTGLLGAGAFGITYLARDTHLDKDVAIKEYLPSACAARAADGSVVPITQQQAPDYRWGLDRFSQEARTLARFSHPHIVRVNRYFESNGTGYMVMDYERGESLKAFVQAQPSVSEATLKAIVGPLLDGLEKVHAAGFLHRDIKPDNIFLRQDGGPVLIDFGSARQTAADSEQALTTIVTPGYAPFEQYTTSKKQGPWSDIYSMGGVLYFLVTGQSPPDALTRMKGDTLAERLAQAPRHYSPGLIEAIAWSLAQEENDRPNNVATWRDALFRCAAPAHEESAQSADAQTARVEPFLSSLALRADVGNSKRVSTQGLEQTMLLLEAASEDADTKDANTQVDVAAPRARGWAWLVGYLLLIGVTATLGAVLGKLPAFQESQMLGGRLSAAMLAQWLGAGGAVIFLWLLGHGVALRLRSHGGARTALYDVLMPVVTLASVAIAYAVAQRLLSPVLDATLIAGAAWGFLLAICACAVWLCMAVLSHTEPLRKLLHQYQRTRAGAGDQAPSAWAGSKEK